jgi:hypothetical protein
MLLAPCFCARTVKQSSKSDIACVAASRSLLELVPDAAIPPRWQKFPYRQNTLLKQLSINSTPLSAHQLFCQATFS